METRILELTRYFPVVAILGARQVGKTTLVDHLPIEGFKKVTFDPVQDVGGAREDPDFFLQNQPRPLFLDEVQYAPELLASIKREVDTKQDAGQFLLSGSQNLSVLRSISESLAGRVAIIELLPLSIAERNEEHTIIGWLENMVGSVKKPQKKLPEQTSNQPSTLYETIWRGGMPGLLDMPEHLLPTYFASYQQTYIERDVRTASQRTQLQRFSRFFGLLAAHTAQEINHTQFGRELNVDRKTSIAWLDIATSTYQWHEIPAYSLNAVKRIAGKPKGYFVDTGLACFLQRIMTPDHISRHPMAGHLFETLIVGEIFKRIASWTQKPNLHHFRTYSGAEVDLILEQNGILHPIEIKMTSKPSARNVRAVRSLMDTFPKANIGEGLLICATTQPQQMQNNITAIPWWCV